MSKIAFQITSLTIVYSTVLFKRRSKKTSKIRVTGLCEGNSPVTGEFPAQRASNAENVSIWWRHHVKRDGYQLPLRLLMAKASALCWFLCYKSEQAIEQIAGD